MAPCHTFIMSYSSDPADKCCDEGTSTASSETSNAAGTSSNPTRPWIDENDTAESSCKEKCCCRDGDQARKEEKPVEDDFQDGCCPESKVIKMDRVEITCQDQSCSGVDEGAPKDYTHNTRCSGNKEAA
jgi:hypothetical protein